jgi:rhodanese-related sulfurtransferase
VSRCGSSVLFFAFTFRLSSSDPRRSSHPFKEAALVVIGGVLFALLANTISPRGLSLTRNYFPGALSPRKTLDQLVRPDGPQVPGASGETNQVPERFAQNGFKLISGSDVAMLLTTTPYQQDLVILVDARDDRHYSEGHIPGAFQFDRYYPEKYLPELLPVAFAAEQIVVYCNGGTCEDSQYAASALKEAGIPAEKISVYSGGIAEWRASHRSLELNGRKSGALQKS